MGRTPDGGLDRARRAGSGRGFAARAVLVYAVLGVIWIATTDRLVDALVEDPAEVWAQTLKGLLFVVASALFLFLVLRTFVRARETAEVDLRRSEERFRTLVEWVPGAVWLNEVDPDDPARTGCIYIAPQIEELLGRTPQEWMSDRDLWWKVIHPDDRERIVAQNEEADEEGVLSMEYRAVHRDGSIVWIHDEAVLIPADGDRPAHWLGVMVDITAQRAADAALRELAESLRGVFAASPLAIVVLEPDGRVRHWNPAAERILGWTAAEVMGRPMPYVPEDKQEEFARLRGRVLAGEAFSGVEVTRLRKDGTPIEVSLSTAPVYDEEGKVEAIVGVIEDITERKRTADELARRAKQQEAVARLGARAVGGGHLSDFLDEALRVVGEMLDVGLVALLEPEGDEGGLVLRAGLGWRSDLIGTQVAAPGLPSLAAYTLGADEPVIVSDLGSERRFSPPPHLKEHGVVSGVSVVVRSSGERPYGTLAVFSREPRSFTRDDAHFLQAAAALVGFAIDRDRAEAALRAAEARYRQLVEAGPGVIYVHDGRQVPAALTYVSPQVVDLLGYPLERWQEDPRFWIECIHPDDRTRVLTAEARAIPAGEPLTLEYRLIAADGREVWVQDRATTVRDADGAPSFRQGLLVDVTERHRAEEERRRALESQLRLATRLEVLHRIDRDVLSTTSVEEMADRALDRLRLLVPYDRATVGFLDEETGTYAILAARSRDGVEPLPVEPLVADDASRALLARPVLSIPDLERFEGSSSLTDAGLAIGVRSVLSVALTAEDQQLGNLVLTSTTSHAFDEESEDIAKEVASQLAIASRQARLRDALQERAEQLERLAEERRQLLHRIVRAQEEERERVSLELHDGLGQVLTSVSLFAAGLEKDVAEHARPRAARVNELVRQAIEDSRQLVWSLRPPELEHLGLVPALRRLVEGVSSHGGIEVDLHEDVGDLRLEPEAEAVVYRIVQEALNNALKHARASVVSVVLRRGEGALSALIEDNGRGFDPGAMGPGQGIGLIGMRERAELVDGTLVVESGDGSGTRVRLEVPVGSSGGSSDGS